MIKDALGRFRRGLKKTRESFVGRLASLFGGRIRLDEDTLDQIEELLIGADMGVKSAVAITQNIEKRLKQEGGEASLSSVLQVIRADVREILTTAKPRIEPLHWDFEAESGGRKKGGRKGRKADRNQGPELSGTGLGAGQDTDTDGSADGSGVAAVPDLRVIFVVGVNGTGKTTSIAKLAYLLKEQGDRVLLAAADTFRAAAVDQLEIWAERVGVDCVRQGPGADPAAVVFDAINAAAARGANVVIVDTAGRLHTKSNLMDELGKVARVIRRKTGRDPETLLVIDGTTGQNGLSQAKVFAETIPVQGLILTKLDGTSKGGIVVAIAETLGLPVQYVGMGETAADLAVFDPDSFVDALFSEWDQQETPGESPPE